MLHLNGFDVLDDKCPGSLVVSHPRKNFTIIIDGTKMAAEVKLETLLYTRHQSSVLIRLKYDL